MIHIEKKHSITIIKMQRPERKNAVHREMAQALEKAFVDFEADASSNVAILTGTSDCFCAGADLKAISQGNPNRLSEEGPGPMGPTRMLLRKPVIAAIAGYAVAGGLELALWCDLRVVEEDAILGVFCRKWGVPLIDGGTVRLPRLIGLSRALDLILTGREVRAQEALQIGLANRVVPKGESLNKALEIAIQLSKFPQNALRSDRENAYKQFSAPLPVAIRNEFKTGFEYCISNNEIKIAADGFVKRKQ